MKIGSDLDGVLAHIEDELVKRIKNKFGLDTGNLHLIGFTKFFDDNELDSGWLNKQWLDEWLWARAEPNLPNIATLQKWTERGHEIHIITGRSQKETAMVTKAWLRKHGVPSVNLQFSPIMHKINYIKAQNISVMFEDMFYEANKIASFGVPCFVVNRSYNKLFKDRATNPLVSFIDTLNDVDDFIKESEYV